MRGRFDDRSTAASHTKIGWNAAKLRISVAYEPQRNIIRSETRCRGPESGSDDFVSEKGRPNG